jgi:IS605 OrfB family transposase
VLFLNLFDDIRLVSGMQRAILLQNVATKSKINILNDFSRKAAQMSNFLLDKKWNRETCDWVDSFNEFHAKVYSASKTNTSFNSQIICDIERNVFRKETVKIDRTTVKFNVPRNCKTFSTKANFFVEFRMYPRNRLAIPVKKNRNWQRYSSLIGNGWVCKTYGLTSDGQIVAYLSKEKEIPSRKNVLGIDVNAKPFAVSVFSPEGKVLYQTYFGKHIWVKRKKIMARRALLQSLKAGKKLKSLRKAESDFVKTNLGQMVREIIILAKRFDADIAIENLKRFSPKGKRFNRKVMRIPFFKFKGILEQRCFDNDIHLDIVDSWHTSKWCSHCGAVAKKGHDANYSLFRCKECAQVVNSDRKASLAVAVKSLLERNSHTANQVCSVQISSRRVPVNGLLRSDEAGKLRSVNRIYRPKESLPTC